MIHLGPQTPAHALRKLCNELDARVLRAGDEVLLDAGERVFPHVAVDDFSSLEVLLDEVFCRSLAMTRFDAGKVLLTVIRTTWNT